MMMIMIIIIMILIIIAIMIIIIVIVSSNNYDIVMTENTNPLFFHEKLERYRWFSQ